MLAGSTHVTGACFCFCTFTLTFQCKKNIGLELFLARRVHFVLNCAWLSFEECHCRSAELIRMALLGNEFLRHLDPGQMKEIAECCQPLAVGPGCLIIREGDAGSLVYVMEGRYSLYVLPTTCVCDMFAFRCPYVYTFHAYTSPFSEVSYLRGFHPCEIRPLT